MGWLPYLLIELFYIDVPVVRTDGWSGGRAIGRSGGRTATWLSKFLGCISYQIFLPMVLAARARSAHESSAKRNYVHIWMFSQKMAPARQKGSGGQARTLAAPRLIYEVAGHLRGFLTCKWCRAFRLHFIYLAISLLNQHFLETVDCTFDFYFLMRSSRSALEMKRQWSFQRSKRCRIF